VTDDIGVLAIPKGAPIQFGGYWVIGGTARHRPLSSS